MKGLDATADTKLRRYWRERRHTAPCSQRFRIWTAGPSGLLETWHKWLHVYTYAYIKSFTARVGLPVQTMLDLNGRDVLDTAPVACMGGCARTCLQTNSRAPVVTMLDLHGKAVPNTASVA